MRFVLIIPRSQARAAIGYSYGDNSDEDQAKRDEQLLMEYLGEEGEEGEEKGDSSDSEFGIQFNLSIVDTSLLPGPNVSLLEKF